MKFGEVLSLRDQEKVLLTICSTTSIGDVRTFMNALMGGCTFTGPVAVFALCSERMKLDENWVGCISNFTNEALDVIREYEKGREPKYQHFWLCCVGKNGDSAPNPRLAYELYPEQTMKRFCERKQWGAIKSLLSYYEEGMAGEDDTESDEANHFYFISSCIDSYVPQEIKDKHGW